MTSYCGEEMKMEYNDMIVKVLNMAGGDTNGFEKGIKSVKLSAIKQELVESLEKNKLNNKSWVIQKTNEIKTTVLYFDIDKLKPNQKFIDIYDKIYNILRQYYSADDLCCVLKLKAKKFKNYHLYFVNIHVSKATLSFIVKKINSEFGESILDERCIHNFIRFEGFKKWDSKTNMFIDGSEYEPYGIEETLTWTDYYDAIYDFNNAETPTLIPIETEQTKTIISQTNEINTETDNNSNSDNNNHKEVHTLLNNMFGVYNWDIQYVKENSFKIINNSNDCLVKKGHQHSTINHSCVYINKTGISNVVCHSHGKKTLQTSKELKEIKQKLGLQQKTNLNVFQQLSHKLLAYGKQHKLKKQNGYILKPSNQSPILYTQYLTYKDFINFVFSNKEDTEYDLFRNNPNNIDKLVKYLDNIDDVELSFLEINKHIFSFKNGYLDISDLHNLKFTHFNDLKTENNISTSIHYDIDFNMEWLKDVNTIETPAFDTIVKNHFQKFENENDNLLYPIFLGLIGRLHYEINTYDRFNCMLYLKGYANTGKSTIGEIVISNHQSVGEIAGNEKVFGLQSCYNKDVIYNGDVKIDFHTHFEKTDLQKIIEGSKIDVPIKNHPSINDYVWKAPVFFVSNYFLGYKDDSNAIARRLAIFIFDDSVENRDTSLRDRLFQFEKHLILLKSLHYYKWLVSHFKNKTFEDWKVKYLQNNTLQVQTKADYVYEFINIPPNDHYEWCVYQETEIVKDKNGENKEVEVLLPVKNFKNAMERFVSKLHKIHNFKYTHNKNVLKTLGYDTIRIDVCGYCGNQPTKKQKKDLKCCENYTAKNRKTKHFIKHLKIINQYDKCNVNDESD